jgi:hypothetical protein
MNTPRKRVLVEMTVFCCFGGACTMLSGSALVLLLVPLDHHFHFAMCDSTETETTLPSNGTESRQLGNTLANSFCNVVSDPQLVPPGLGSCQD